MTVMTYNVYWEGGVYRTRNRRDAAEVGLRWIKEGRQVSAELTCQNPTTKEIKTFPLPFGSSGRWTFIKWKSIADSLNGGA